MGDVGGRKRADPKEADVDDGVPGAELVPDEPEPDEGGSRDDEHRRPAKARPLVEGKEGGGERGAESEGPAQVERFAGRRMARVPHHEGDQTGRDEDERHPEPEHRLPTEQVDEHTADDRSEHEGGGEPGGVPAEDPAPIAFGKGEGGEGRSAAQKERVSRPLKDTGHEQPPERRRECAENERDRAPQEPDHEHPLVANDVREAAEPRHEGRVGEDVADDDPLDGGDVVVECGGDGGERDVDRRIERRRGNPEGHDEKGEPGP